MTATPLLTGKSLVIIGGTTGIGLSAAQAFIAQGARVVVVGRSTESAAKAGAALGEQALVIPGEIGRAHV